MRALLIIGIVVIAMAFAGWLTFSSQDDNASVTVQTDEIKEDTKAAVEEGERLLEKTAEKGRQLMENSSSDEELKEDQADKASSDRIGSEVQVE